MTSFSVILSLLFALSGLAPRLAGAAEDQLCCAAEAGEADSGCPDLPCGTSECPFCQTLFLDQNTSPDFALSPPPILLGALPCPSLPRQVILDRIDQPPESL